MDTNHRYLLGQLLKSPNPARMLKEFKENGAEYISDYMLQAIDEYISREQKVIAGIYNVKGKTPLSEYEPGLTGIKNDIKKAERIKQLFLFSEDELKAVENTNTLLETLRKERKTLGKKHTKRVIAKQNKTKSAKHK